MKRVIILPLLLAVFVSSACAAPIHRIVGPRKLRSGEIELVRGPDQNRRPQPISTLTETHKIQLTARLIAEAQASSQAQTQAMGTFRWHELAGEIAGLTAATLVVQEAATIDALLANLKLRQAGMILWSQTHTIIAAESSVYLGTADGLGKAVEITKAFAKE